MLSEVDSTNAEALRLAPNVAGPEWILGLRQTKGRGRRGRAWADPVGNFSATLLMHPAEAPDQVALRSFAASLALYDAFAELGAQGLALKWPNDVLLNGQKLAGILLESTGRDGRIDALCIGIGVNLIHAPDAVEEGAVPPTSLRAATGQTISPEGFLDTLAPAYARWEATFQTHGFAPIRTEWLNRAAKLGEVITARTMRDTHVGRFDTVDEGGNLVLQTDSGPVSIAAADVFF